MNFRLDVLDTGESFHSSPNWPSLDGFSHAAVGYMGECSWMMVFEDQSGGGDLDFNDFMIIIEGDIRL